MSDKEEKHKMSPKEVFDLIEIYGLHKNSVSNPNLWKEIEIEMKNKEYTSSWIKYRIKWKSLKTTYERKTKENKIAEPWPFFKAMKKILNATDTPKKNNQKKITQFFQPAVTSKRTSLKDQTNDSTK